MAVIRTRRLAIGSLGEITFPRVSNPETPETQGIGGTVFTAPAGLVTIIRHVDFTSWSPATPGLDVIADAYAMISTSGQDILFAQVELIGRGNANNVAVMHKSWNGTCVLYEGESVYLETGHDVLHYQISGAQLVIA